MREGQPNTFCLEGEWDSDLTRRLSVRPVLELIEAVPWRHRDVLTRPEHEYYLEKWTLDGYADFPVLWLAVHGSKTSITLSGDAADVESGVGEVCPVHPAHGPVLKTAMLLP